MNLIADDVCKKIKGKTILSHVSLSMQNGKIYGFIGENGSGKTMLFRVLSGLIKIDSGEILINDKILHKNFSVLPNLGITIENAGLYSNLTGMENLCYLAKLQNKIGNKEITDALIRVGLEPLDKRTYKKYSLGMKQRLMIAQAIMEKPDIIMLDEPTNALDEKGIDLIRKVILDEKKRGALILVASHNKDDISILSDEVYEVVSGEVKRQVGLK